MDYNKRPYFYGTGRRKKSVARVRLYAGTGSVKINDRDIDEYFGLETLKLIVRQPGCRRRRHRPGRRHPSRHRSRPAAVQQRGAASSTEESGLPDPRSENEGTQEVRSQSRSSRSAVLQEIIIIKMC